MTYRYVASIALVGVVWLAVGACDRGPALGAGTYPCSSDAECVGAHTCRRIEALGTSICVAPDERCGSSEGCAPGRMCLSSYCLDDDLPRADVVSGASDGGRLAADGAERDETSDVSRDGDARLPNDVEAGMPSDGDARAPSDRDGITRRDTETSDTDEETTSDADEGRDARSDIARDVSTDSSGDVDYCPDTPNPSQADSDGDGMGTHATTSRSVSTPVSNARYARIVTSPRVTATEMIDSTSRTRVRSSPPGRTLTATRTEMDTDGSATSVIPLFIREGPRDLASRVKEFGKLEESG